jgi:hypothetical protein
MFKLQLSLRFIATGLVAALSLASGAAPAIGFLTAKGTVLLDTSPASGHGTIFDGSTVETGLAASQIQMQNDAHMSLGSESRAKIYRDHTILEKGDSQLSGSSHYWLQARGLQIRSLESASATVSLLGDKQVLVAAMGGPVRVANGQGLLVAWVESGRTLQLEPKDGGGTPISTLKGCLQKINERYILTDQTAGVTVELVGPGLDKEAGNSVEVTGRQDTAVAAAAGASQVIRVSSVKQVSTHCLVAGAGHPAAAGRAGATGTAAAGASHTTAIVAGVVIAGAATGTIVGLTAAAGKSSISQ